MSVRNLATAVVFSLSAVAASSAFASSSTLPVELEEGARIYADNCASCHGDNLQGQPDWRTPDEDGVLPAPPHDSSGHTWHHGDKLLFLYTKFGGKALMEARGMEFNSGMPPFREVLSDEEINQVLAYIKSTWSEKERAVQAERSAGEG